MYLTDWPWIVAEPQLADVGWPVYESLWQPLLEKQKGSRKPIPSFGEFLLACHEGESIQGWLDRRGFRFPDPEFGELIGPMEENLRVLLNTKPLLVPRL
ncbi:MAG: hypothetical protein AAB455_01070 [Patescibacteria group bacterium]